MSATHLYPWLVPTWQRLLELFESKRVPHAVLLSGAKGIGKTLLVATFEKLLLCQTPQQGPCGKCRTCHLFEQNHHPDRRHLGEDEKAISIDDVRELTHFLEQTSHQKGYKVVTLFQADELSIASANALLKMLEEPLGNTILILIAERPTNMLATLRSRCMHIHLSLPTSAMSLSWLQKNCPETEPSYLQQSLVLAAGSPLRAREFLSDDMNILRNVFSKAVLAKPESLFHSKDIQQFITTQPKEALYLFYYWVTEVIRYALHAFAGYLYTDEQEKDLERLARKIPLKKIFIFFADLTESIKALSLPGTNKQLLFETLFYQWQLIHHEGSSHGPIGTSQSK